MRCDPQEEMVSADQPALSDKKYLGYCVAAVHFHGDHIFVLAVAACDLLLLCDLADAVFEVTPGRCLLVLHTLRGIQHPLFEHFQDWSVVSIQKIHRSV